MFGVKGRACERTCTQKQIGIDKIKLKGSIFTFDFHTCTFEAQHVRSSAGRAGTPGISGPFGSVACRIRQSARQRLETPDDVDPALVEQLQTVERLDVLGGASAKRPGGT